MDCIAAVGPHLFSSQVGHERRWTLDRPSVHFAPGRRHLMPLTGQGGSRLRPLPSSSRTGWRPTRRGRPRSTRIGARARPHHPRRSLQPQWRRGGGVSPSDRPGESRCVRRQLRSEVDDAAGWRHKPAPDRGFRWAEVSPKGRPCPSDRNPKLRKTMLDRGHEIAGGTPEPFAALINPRRRAGPRA